MRLLCVIDSVGSGGAQRQMHAVASRMKRLGWDVAIAWYTESDFYRARLEEAGVLCFQDSKENTLWKRLVFLRRVEREFRPDSVLAFLPTPAFLCSLLKCLTFASWRLVVSIRGNNEERFTWTRNRFYRLFYSVASCVICNSHAEANVWKRHAPGFAPKLRVIPNFVQVPQVTTASSIRPDGKTHLLVAANLISNLKNPVNVVKALALLPPEEQRSIVIDWFGSRGQDDRVSDFCQSVESMIRDAGLKEVFRTHDATQEIYREMQAADIIGLFSTEEGLPNVICEAMALGKPVVMTKVSDWENLVQGNGFVCAGTDAESIRDALRAIIHSENTLLSEMGRKSRVLAEALFEESQMISAWQAALTPGA